MSRSITWQTVGPRCARGESSHPARYCAELSSMIWSTVATVRGPPPKRSTCCPSSTINLATHRTCDFARSPPLCPWSRDTRRPKWRIDTPIADGARAPLIKKVVRRHPPVEYRHATGQSGMQRLSASKLTQIGTVPTTPLCRAICSRLPKSRCHCPVPDPTRWPTRAGVTPRRLLRSRPRHRCAGH